MCAVFITYIILFFRTFNLVLLLSYCVRHRSECVVICEEMFIVQLQRASLHDPHRGFASGIHSQTPFRSPLTSFASIHYQFHPTTGGLEKRLDLQHGNFPARYFCQRELRGWRNTEWVTRGKEKWTEGKHGRGKDGRGKPAVEVT